MHTKAIIEILPRPDGRAPAELLADLYRASTEGVVVLALRGLDAGAIDAILDDIVPRLPLSIPGVVYVDADDEDALLDAARTAELIFATTSHFRDLVEENGVDPDAVHPTAVAMETLHLSVTTTGAGETSGGEPSPTRTVFFS